jgi:fructose-1,6-bisphosphatase/inositol monophosphatase family enzyme
VIGCALEGPYEAPAAQAQAWSWNIATRETVNLIDQARSYEPERLQDLAILTHLTRSDPAALQAFIRDERGEASILEQCHMQAAGTYMVNSGLTAMRLVAANPGFAAFLNTRTKGWDVCGGQVLVEAIGGVVSNFEGDAIDYAEPGPVSVIAARTPALHTEIQAIVARQPRGASGR